MSKWKENFKKEINGTSAIVTVVGTTIGSASTLLASPVIAAGGFLLGLGGLAYASVKAIPKKLQSAKDNVDKTLKIEDLEEIETLKSVGIVGDSSVGKTTLLELMQFKQQSHTRTDELYASILSIPNTSKYICMIDGAGQEFVQQFEIIDHSYIIILLLDHNKSSDSILMNKDRLSHQKIFFQQLINYINNNESKKRIHLLFNKRDKWEESKRKNEILTFFNDIEMIFKDNPLIKLSSSNHSNFIREDLSKLWEVIKKEVKNDN